MADRAAISLEEFKARLPIAEVVGRHVRLSRRGRDLWGCCPFHNEKTASFTSSDKGFYHCFGCGQHGNAIDFVMAIEGLEFAQALQRLAELTGLPAPRAARRASARGRPGPSTPPIEAAARWFAGRLESARGRRGAAYLRRAGSTRRPSSASASATRRTSARRSSGPCSPRAIPRRAARGRPAGPGGRGASYDRFRDRVMFPIQDQRGRVVGFGGRALGAARAKYLNTPETPAFHKGELLYGLPLARAAIRERGTVIVAEGYMDVIALAQAGFAHAVAPLGTAIGEAQLAQLWQLADEPLICLDGDEAGLRAGHRLIERALPLLAPGKSLRFALLPPGRGSRLGAARPQRGVPWRAGAPARPRRGDPAPGFPVGARNRDALAHGAAAALGAGATLSALWRRAFPSATLGAPVAQRFLQAIEGGCRKARGCRRRSGGGWFPPSGDPASARRASRRASPRARASSKASWCGRS